MTHSFFIRLSQLSVFVLMLVLTGCQKRDDALAQPQTITDRILEDSQFGLFRVAMVHGRVADALKDGNLTIFAPTDAAFQASGLGTEAAILAMSPEQAARFVLAHVLYSRVKAADIPAGLNPVETAGKSVAFFNKSSDGAVYVNSARVIQTDIETANGYLHTIDRVLNPTAGNLLNTIQSNPDLTFLSAAIKRVATSTPNLIAQLTNTSVGSSITVFAPNDTAFKADKVYNSLTAIETANVQTLANTLLYHLLPGITFSNQFQTKSVNTLLNGSALTIFVMPNTVTVKGNKNQTSAVIKQADLAATNGVIHSIDQVLLP